MGLLFFGSYPALLSMARSHSFEKITGPLSHLPTWFFIIGYPAFWLQLFTHTAGRGVTCWLWWALWGTVVILALRQVAWPKVTELLKIFNGRGRIFWLFSLAPVIFIFSLVIIASLKPIHLLQESDCMQYHYTLPRQHLILGSFAHIPWAADDLFLLPVDFALAPFWFTSALPNKIPQFIIFLGLIAVIWRLTSFWAGKQKSWSGPLAALLVLSTHGFGIQMGTGMLDLSIAYLFLAALDSLREGYWVLAAVEFTFFFWSKPLMPLEICLTALIMGLGFFWANSRRWPMTDNVNLPAWPKALSLSAALSLLIGAPFVAKSLYYAGTPLFPLMPGLFSAEIKTHPVAWHSLQQASWQWTVASREAYGHGFGVIAFIKHLWLLAVPERGVNNAFDYPLGLTYLLMIGPFLFFLVKDVWRRKFSVMGILSATMWLLWWFSVQQSRFLYLPLLIIYIITVARFERPAPSFLACILTALLLESLSVWGAHGHEINRWGLMTLRGKDQQLVRLSADDTSSGMVEWPTHDVAYAQFPVVVRQEQLPHTIRF